MISTTSPVAQKLLTEQAVFFTKMCFEGNLKKYLPLSKVAAPAIVLQGTGINDDLSGRERPVHFPIKSMGDKPAEVVQSLAKWKRLRLQEYSLPPGQGIYTDMRALRPEEDLGQLHSLFVDQWDWEMTMEPEERNLAFLTAQVKKIYRAILDTQAELSRKYSDLPAFLPSEITFIHTEHLLKKYPRCSPKDRENLAAKEFGAIFLIGIGGELANGKAHDDRAPDYDDWSTPTSDSTKGLNGDLILWDPVQEQAVEISSMGIRVDPDVLEKQLKIRGAESRSSLFYHQELLRGRLPQSVGGGIGQSRLCMFLLRKQHIGEVQAGIWPAAMRRECESQGIFLL